MYNLEQFEHGADDVMILATDGLWDVLSNKEVAEAVTSFLGNCDPDNHYRQVLQYGKSCLRKWQETINLHLVPISSH